ncbi:hypothetical protein [Cellulosimicrobium funkei]|uniref:hypothetical protein n=1 Tax=Cellulosimicrobium funkei TaxID=264251 RepID=UPI00341B8EFA
MSTARDYLAAVQQRADAATPHAARNEPWVAQALAADSTVLGAALTAALDLADRADRFDGYADPEGVVTTDALRAVITDALTPKENDS